MHGTAYIRVIDKGETVNEIALHLPTIAKDERQCRELINGVGQILASLSAYLYVQTTKSE